QWHYLCVIWIAPPMCPGVSGSILIVRLVKSASDQTVFELSAASRANRPIDDAVGMRHFKCSRLAEPKRSASRTVGLGRSDIEYESVEIVRRLWISCFAGTHWAVQSSRPSIVDLHNVHIRVLQTLIQDFERRRKLSEYAVGQYRLRLIVRAVDVNPVGRDPVVKIGRVP